MAASALVRLLAALPCLPVSGLRSAGGGVSVAASTPVEKVVALLGKLSQQITEEGSHEAAEYDKFACFCKEQADAKTYSIKKSEEKIAALDAAINALGADIADLNADVGTLGQKVTTLEGDISTEEASREVARQSYEVADNNVTEAIEAVQGAIAMLKASKGDMQGAKLDLAQIRAAILQVPLPSHSSARLDLLERTGTSKQPAYAYKSNDIIELLQDLLMQFKARKQALFEDEHRLKSISEETVLGLMNEKKFKEKEKLQKEAIADAKTTDKHEAQLEKDAETKAKKADEDFRGELASQCQTKATEWDQRSKARAEELTAISEAVEILKTTVDPMYAANKKLVGLQRGAAARPGLPASFLQQLQRRRLGHVATKAAGAETTAASVVQRALRGLDAEAGRLGSPRLSTLAAKAAVEADHFAKVRGLINDLIARLEAEAQAEATSKSVCDQDMAQAVSSRDKEKMNIEKEAATISEEAAKKAKLMEEIASLSNEIASLAKALNEATELRSEEKRDNKATEADAKAGKAAVEQAIALLEAFYAASGGVSLVQRDTPKADREGKTVGDRAPQVSWSGNYAGKTDASKGILGLLQVILSDFDRTITSVGTSEASAAQAFQQFETTANGDMTAKKGDKTTKETDVTTAEAAITTAQDAKMDAERRLRLVNEELDTLRAMCVEGEESWSERKAKREQEIEALKQALTILEQWQG